MFNFGKSRKNVESAVDDFLAQRIVMPQVYLKPARGEVSFRVYGHSEYASLRKDLLDGAILAKEPFWNGKVYLRATQAPRPQTVDSKILEVVFNDQVVGEISEFDSVARELFSFEDGVVYVGRAVIRGDLIGNLIHLFVDPKNRLS